MSNKDTAMTIVIDDMLKKKAKVNALMSNMTLKEYIAYLIKKDCEVQLNAFLEVVSDELAKGEKIQLIGFGTFEVGERATRTCRNPQTGAEMTVPACKAPKFKAGKALKDKVNA